MIEEEPHYTPTLITIVGSAVVALLFLLLVIALQPLPPPPAVEGEGLSATPRQEVVIFVVDSSDAAEAHGEHVQSVIRQQCPRCRVQAVNLRGDLSPPTLVEALQHVDDLSQPYDATATLVVNLSLGTYIYDEVLHAMVRRLDARGVVLIAAAGNDDTAKPFYPAALSEVLGICSSTRHTRTKAAYSNFGPWVGLCAPGWQYVNRPLSLGGVASGTSFASPMVAGVLGHLLLEAPCATRRMALRALKRTADLATGERRDMGAGIVNASAAAHYLRTLYACNDTRGVRQRLLAKARRFGTGVATYAALIAYFFFSIFAGPFLLAFVLEQVQRREARRQHQAVQQAYEGSLAYRCQRLQELRQRFAHTRKVRRRDRAELGALVHAVYVYGESCGWCDRPADEAPEEWSPEADLTYCLRCGLAFTEDETSTG